MRYNNKTGVKQLDFSFSMTFSSYLFHQFVIQCHFYSLVIFYFYPELAAVTLWMWNCHVTVSLKLHRDGLFCLEVFEIVTLKLNSVEVLQGQLFRISNLILAQAIKT